MDFHDPNSFLRQHWMEISGVFTLVVSLWIAFGPLRHRLPRFLTRLGKYSATLKLVSLSGVCCFLLYRCLTDDVPSLAINWMLGFLALVLLAGAAFVVTRKQVDARPTAHHREKTKAGALPHSDAAHAPTAVTPRAHPTCRPTSAPAQP